MNKNKTLPIRSEHDEQVTFFKLVDIYSEKHPALKNVYAIPNGGHRHKATAVKLNAEGVRAGYPDINVDVARHGYHGLRIEMKRSDGGKGLSNKQIEWFARLEAEGYLCHMCHGCDEAWSLLGWYLGEQIGFRDFLKKPLLKGDKNV